MAAASARAADLLSGAERVVRPKIAREWHVPHAGVGYVMEFDVDAAYLERIAVQQVGGRDVLELWVPAEELAEFNAHIVGGIRQFARYDTVRG